MSTPNSARTYNQNHVPRKYTPGKRRVSIYWTWSYPWESQRDLTEIDNRFSTMTEVRRVVWPAYETPEYNAAQFLQGIAGRWNCFTGRLSTSRGLPKTSPATPWRFSSESIRRATGCQLMKGHWPTPTLCWSSGSITLLPSKTRSQKKSRPFETGFDAKTRASFWPPITMSAFRPILNSVRWNISITATRSSRASSALGNIRVR